MASDRGNTRLSGRYSSLAPPFLRALKRVIEMGHKMDVPITVCGELAGKPLGSMALLAMGYRRLSMSPSSIGPIKSMVLDLPLDQLSAEFGTLLDKAISGDDIKVFLTEFSQRHNVPI